jgi:hypothetical protein
MPARIADMEVANTRHARLFTVDEANRTLPLVRRIVEDIVQAHRLWREKILELDLVASTTRADQPHQQAEQLERDAQAIAREIDAFERELTDLGIQIKDRRLGLVDYPSLMGTRKVLLCWRLGEPDVRFWHEMNAGFRGRQPLEPVPSGDEPANPVSR